jgi:hypothetical protein
MQIVARYSWRPYASLTVIVGSSLPAHRCLIVFRLLACDAASFLLSLATGAWDCS